MKIPPFLLLFLFIFLLPLIQTNAQNPSDNTDPNTPDSVSNFQPSLAVVIGMLAVMFSLTFVLLLYAKFCHRAASIHSTTNSHQIHDGLPRSRSLAAGVDKTVVESLPFFRFSSLKGSRDGLECAVCLAKFEDVDILRLLPKCKHAFHIDCIDQWLEKHSTCPLCRRKVTADDLSHLHLSTSLRFLYNPPPPDQLGRQDSNLELYVEREESRHGSSRFCIGGSFRKDEEEAPIPESMDCDSPPSPSAALHRFNHKIVVAEAVLKNRWSNVSSSDIMFLNSEILMKDAPSSARFPSVEEAAAAEEKRKSAETVIMSIKEEMERKRAFEGKVREINKEVCDDHLRNFPATSSDSNRRKLGFESSSSWLNPKDKRSMSEIVVYPRLITDLRNNKDSSVQEINVKEERTRRLWLPIARKTVQWFANRERRSSPQSQELRVTKTTASSCDDEVSQLTPCYSYIEGLSSPASDCCSHLGKVAAAKPECLCQVLHSDNNNINKTRIMGLPKACNVTTPPASLCNSSLPSSPGYSTNMSDPAQLILIVVSYSLLLFFI